MEYKRLYLAYGSNINLEQMAYRCPTAKVIGVTVLPNQELNFRRVATIDPKEGSEVPVLVWEIGQQDEINLDYYEGFPRLYRKEIFELEVNGKMRECMAYVMNHGGISPPSSQYYNGIKQGYEANGMDVNYLRDALQRSHDVVLTATESMDEESDETEDMQMGWSDNMLYKGFYVKMTPATLTRTDKDGNEVQCEGFTVEVFDSDVEKVEIDTFSIAVGYEILANDIHEAEQLVKDYIECEEKEYCRMMEEYYSNE